MWGASGRGRGQRGRERGRSTLNDNCQPHVASDDSALSDSDNSANSSASSGNYCCPICGLPTRLLWVACDSCDRWFHAECTDIDPNDYDDLENIDWICGDCN